MWDEGGGSQLNRETVDEIFAMATALVIGYWGVQLTGYIWEVVCIVLKTLIAGAILPE